MPRRLRKSASGGSISLRNSQAFTGALAIDAEKGVISNVSIISKGPALGHGFEVDDVMLQQVAAGINAMPKGVKSRLTHPGVPDCGGWDGIETMLGRVRNARVLGDKVIGDAFLGNFAAMTPAGDLRSYLLAIAAEDPGLIGISIVFEPDDFEVEEDSDNPDNTVEFGRVKSVMAADFVGDPAANADGLLSRLPTTVLSRLPDNLLHSWLTAALGQAFDASVEDYRAKLIDRRQRGGGIDPSLSSGGPAMDPILRAHLVSLGLNPTATDAEAKAFASKLAADQQAKIVTVGLAAAFTALCGTAPVKPVTSVDSAPVAPAAGAPALSQAQIESMATARAEQMLAADRTRQSEIRKLAKGVGLDATWVDVHIEAGTTLAVAQADALAKLAEKHKPVAGAVSVGDDANRASLGAALGDSLLVRGNVALHKIGPDGLPVREANGQLATRQAHERSREFRGLSLVETARVYLQAVGVKTAGLSRNEVAELVFNRAALARAGGVALGMGTGDFPAILADVMYKTLRAAYVEQMMTWPTWARRTTHADFRNVYSVQLSESALQDVAAGGEYPDAKLTDSKESYKLAKKGLMLNFNWETLINDDLGAFTRPLSLGRACYRAEEDVAYKAFISNPVMAEDATTLFHATHANLASGGGAAALSVATLGAARAAMSKQKDIGKKATLNLDPAILLVPRAQQTVAEQLIGSVVDPTKNNATINPFANKFKVVSNSRLDDDSATAWYLFVDPNMYDTVEVAFLEGENGPMLTEEDGFAVDGRRYKVRHVVAARALDYRGLYKNPGA